MSESRRREEGEGREGELADEATRRRGEPRKEADTNLMISEAW